MAQGAIVYGVDGGAEKGEFLKQYGIHGYIDFTTTPDVVAKVKELTNGGADAAIVVANNQKAYAQAAEMLTIGGTLNCVGLPGQSLSPDNCRHYRAQGPQHYRESGWIAEGMSRGG